MSVPTETLLMLATARITELEALLAQAREDLDEEQSHHAWQDKRYIEAAEAIRRDPGWATDCWPSANDRVWHRVAQERIAELESLLAQMTEARDEAVEFIGAMRDEMVRAGMPGGDRVVLLANFIELLAIRDHSGWGHKRFG